MDDKYIYRRVTLGNTGAILIGGNRSGKVSFALAIGNDAGERSELNLDLPWQIVVLLAAALIQSLPRTVRLDLEQIENASCSIPLAAPCDHPLTHGDGFMADAEALISLYTK